MPEGPRRRRPGLTRVAVLALALAGCAHVPVGPAPDYRASLWLPTASGKAPPQLGGKVVLVQFFATWCFPCMAAFEQLEVVHEKVHSPDLAVVAVGMDLEGEQVLAPFISSYKPGFPVLVADETIRKGRSPFGRIRQLPATYVLDRQGHPVAAFAGVTTPAELERIVRKALRR